MTEEEGKKFDQELQDICLKLKIEIENCKDRVVDERVKQLQKRYLEELAKLGEEGLHPALFVDRS